MTSSFVVSASVSVPNVGVVNDPSYLRFATRTHHAQAS